MTTSTASASPGDAGAVTGSGSSASGGLAGLALLSAAVLTLEVLQTRIFSYCLHPILLYFAVGIAFLGLGASGTLLALWSGWRRLPAGRVGSVACLGFALSTIATSMLFARTSVQLTQESAALSAGQLLLLGAMSLPYLFAGAGITALLSTAGDRIHRTYLVNLVGSAAGCFIVFALLQPLGPGGLLVALALAGVGAAGLFGGLGGTRDLVLGVAAALCAAPLLDLQAAFPFQPEPSGQLALLVARQADMPGATGERRTHFDAWNATGRIEISEFVGVSARVPEPLPIYFYSQDSSAGSILLGVGDDPERARGFFERTLYGAVYHLRSGARADVLVIGLGGGPDMLGAHLAGAATITGVDINQSAIDAIGGPLATFTGNVYNGPGVDIVTMDGRTFVRSTERRFDIIIMSGVDTKSVLSAGSLALSENTLYTVEALREYLGRLSDGGVLALLRFGVMDRMRLVATAVEALRQLGVEQPDRCIAVLEQNWWGSVLVSRQPLEEADVERLVAWVDSVPEPDTGIRIPMYDVLEQFKLTGAPAVVATPFSKPSDPGDDAGSLLEAVRLGREQAVLDALPVYLDPTTDDRPFFFDHQRREKLLSEPLEHYKLMGGFLLELCLLAALLILAPLPLFGRRGAGETGRLRCLAYFFCLGAGFMLLEIGLVQQLLIFLGHQAYSLTVVFATLLVSAGLGSAASARWSADGAPFIRWRVVPAIAVLATLTVVLVEFGAPAAATLPLPARIALVAVTLAPLGFVLGMPFPTGLAALRTAAPGLLPWAIGANGFASVLGSSAALLGAMILGYRALLLVGLALYVAAAISFPRSPTRPTAS